MRNYHALEDQLGRLRQEMTGLAGISRKAEANDLVLLFVKILPKLFDAERCGIFFREPETDIMHSRFGTDIDHTSFAVTNPNSYAGRAVSLGTTILDNHVDPTEDSQMESQKATGFVARNIICSPIRSPDSDQTRGVIQILNKAGTFEQTDVALLEEVAARLSMVLHNLWLNERIGAISSKVTPQLEEIRLALGARTSFVAVAPSMLPLLKQVQAVSHTPASILLRGENGTGKDLVARMVHKEAGLSNAPFVAVNCAAIPHDLLESEFFGYERGAFTGASRARGGFFEEAKGGTLFLDEIADMPLALQAKLLRVLEEREGRRLGCSIMRQYDFRLISATHQNLDAMVNEGTFREDLYYRLFAVAIELPPLRKRREDILPLTLEFLADLESTWNKSIAGIPGEIITLFEGCPWPGNIRQLRREVERLMALTPPGEWAKLEDCSDTIRSLQISIVPPSSEILSLQDELAHTEQQLIGRALLAHDGHKTNTAKALGITRQALHYKMKRWQ